MRESQNSAGVEQRAVEEGVGVAADQDGVVRPAPPRPDHVGGHGTGTDRQRQLVRAGKARVMAGGAGDIEVGAERLAEEQQFPELGQRGADPRNHAAGGHIAAEPLALDQGPQRLVEHRRGGSLRNAGPFADQRADGAGQGDAKADRARIAQAHFPAAHAIDRRGAGRRQHHVGAGEPRAERRARAAHQWNGDRRCVGGEIGAADQPARTALVVVGEPGQERDIAPADGLEVEQLAFAAALRVPPGAGHRSAEAARCRGLGRHGRRRRPAGGAAQQLPDGAGQRDAVVDRAGVAQAQFVAGHILDRGRARRGGHHVGRGERGTEPGTGPAHQRDGQAAGIGLEVDAADQPARAALLVVGEPGQERDIAPGNRLEGDQLPFPAALRVPPGAGHRPVEGLRRCDRHCSHAQQQAGDPAPGRCDA